jgi:hypothetical protein
MARGGEGEGLLFSDVIGDAGVDLIESAQEVENEDGLRCRLPDVMQFISLLLHVNAVDVD